MPLNHMPQFQLVSSSLLNLSELPVIACKANNNLLFLLEAPAPKNTMFDLLSS